MSTPFTRTPTGMVGKWQFYSVPTIWVEGPTDVFFYTPIVDDLECRIEPFHGKENGKALLEGLANRDLPYIVVLDGDYEILGRAKRRKRVITLSRYSFECYLWEAEPLNRACHRSAQSGERTDVISSNFTQLNSHMLQELRDLVELDIASRRSDPSPKVLPDRIEMILIDQRRPEICPKKVAAIIGSVTSQLKQETVSEARNDVTAFLQKRRFSDLLKGHLLFGILRLLFSSTASAIKGGKIVLNDDALTQILADAIWRRMPHDDHKSLKTRLRKHVRSIAPRFATKPSVV